MPTYQYACTACGNQLEAVQSFADEPLTQCPACEGRLRKLFGSVGIVFKGSGFYRNDSRAAATGNGANGNGNGKSGDSKETDGKPGGNSKDTASKDSASKDSGSKDSASKEKATTDKAPASSASPSS